MWEPDRGRLGRRFGSRRRAPARAPAEAASWRSASRWRRRPSAASSAARRSPPTAACERRSRSCRWPSAASPPPGWGRRRPAATAEIDRAATAALARGSGRAAPAAHARLPRAEPGRAAGRARGRRRPRPLAAPGVGPAAPRVRAAPAARSSRPAATPVTSVSEPGLRLVVVGRTAGPLPVTLAPLTAVDPPGQGRPAAGARGRRRLGALHAAGLLGDLPRLRVDDADRPAEPCTTGRSTGLLDREARRRAQRAPAGHAVRAHRPDEHARRPARGRRRSPPGGCSSSAAAPRRSCSVSCSSPPPGCAATPGTEWARLERHGARLGQLWTFAWVEAAWITARRGGGRARSRSGGDRDRGRAGRRRAAAASLRHTIVSGPGIAAIVGGVDRRRRDPRRRRAHRRRRPAPRARVRGLDLAALAIVGAVALAAARGSANSTSLASGSDPLLALLPGLVAVAAAIVTARLAGPLLRIAGRGLRRGPPSVRLALVSLGPRGRTADAGRRLPRRGDRPRRLRGRLPGHADPGRARPGRLPGAARLHRVRGPRAATAARGRAALAVSEPRPGHAGGAGHPLSRHRARARDSPSRRPSSACPPARIARSATGGATSPRSRRPSSPRLRPARPPTLDGADLPPARLERLARP